MNRRVGLYTVGVLLIGALSAFILFVSEPDVAGVALGPVLILAAAALVAEALSIALPNSAIGSLGFIPYLTAALIAPHWISLAAVTIVRLIVEMFSTKKAAWRVFNTAQQALTMAIAILTYRVCGGVSLASISQLTLVEVTAQAGLPALAAFTMSFAVNSTIVTSVLAARDGKDFGEIWRTTFSSTIALDILAAPIVFLFAWIFVHWGAFAAAAIWVPVLGLRHLQKNNLDLARSNSELLELMVKSMEARDPYTSGHSRRVQQFSVAIARGLGLSPTEVDNVSRAALLHDVGKIYEKYAPILRKPGKLSADEWQTMQQHPVDGAALVATVSRLHDIIPAIRHHHERWDGTGYPDGLAGEMIPQASRIIAFADTIDAMISERPYRRTMDESDVRAEIVRCRAAQFDPEMADKILSAPVWRLIFAPVPSHDAMTFSLITTKPSIARRA